MTRYLVDANVWVGAFDQTDSSHSESVAFFEGALRADDSLLIPALALVEVPCAVRRRTGKTEFGEAAYEALLRHPSLIVQAVDSDLLTRGVALGVKLGLTGGDAIYAAAAERTAATLVTWDRELLNRVDGAVTPASRRHP